MNTGVVVLAAGDSKRMGVVKQILPVFNVPLLKYLVSETLKTDLHPITVVVGAHRTEVVGVLENMPIGIVDNPGWQEGVGSSIRMGLIGSYMLTKGIEALIFVSADMPDVNVGVLSDLRELGENQTDFMLIKPKGSNFPFLIKAHLFENLLDLKDDASFESLLKNPTIKVLEFESDFCKIETPEDYLRYLENYN
jgi:molybdenum cofactor cytidylyltransferase